MDPASVSSRSLYRAALCLFVAGFVALALVACSDDAEPAAAPSPTPTPVNVADALARSVEAMDALDTFHFTLEHEGDGGTPLTESLTVTEAEGTIVNPDSLTIEFVGTLGTFAIRSGFVTIGDESFMTNPLTSEWEPIPTENSPVGFFDPQGGIAAMMEQIERPSLVSQSDGKLVIDGDLPPSALASLLGRTDESGVISVRVTIDEDTLYLERAVLDGRVTTIEPDGVVRIVTFSRFNEPVVIERPD